VDEDLIWSIAGGGKLLGSDMPAFKDRLDEDEIWQIITYIWAGFPAVGGEIENLDGLTSRRRHSEAADEQAMPARRLSHDEDRKIRV
jgi:hypothetical protein